MAARPPLTLPYTPFRSSKTLKYTVDVEGKKALSVYLNSLDSVFVFGAPVWAKVKGHPWWPAEALSEYKYGQLVDKRGKVQVMFCATAET